MKEHDNEERAVDALIAKYPEIFVPYEGNPGNVNWSLPVGWIPLLDNLCMTLKHYADWKKKSYKCMQMKEKFGGLRFYLETGDDDDFSSGVIALAERESCRTCADCGTTHEVGITTGWILPMCQTCFNKTELAARGKTIRFTGEHVKFFRQLNGLEEWDWFKDLKTKENGRGSNFTSEDSPI